MPLADLIDEVGYTEIESKPTDHTRWSVWHEVIVEDADGNHWQYTIERPATESQEAYPEDPVTLTAIMKVPTFKWAPIELPPRKEPSDG